MQVVNVVYPLRRAVLAAIGLALVVGSASAQSAADSQNELAELKADLARIKADLEVVKGQLGQLLRLMGRRQAAGGAPAPAGPVQVSVADAPVLGRPDAPVTIVEFSDYQCPFCQRFFATTLPVIKRDYIDTGKVRYVFRDFPIDQIHPLARKAAEAAHCAGDQGRYWEMQDTLYASQNALAPAQLGEHARKLELDGAAFDECVSSGRHAARVSKGNSDGAAAGVTGTPGFVVARTTPGDTVEGVTILGAQRVEVFRQLIDNLLDPK